MMEALTPFELYMLEEDRPDYPMCGSVVLELDRVPDREAFEEAAAVAGSRHPLACSRVEERGGRPGWRLLPPDRRRIEWTRGEGDLHARIDPRIDLRSEPGARIRVEEGAGGARVLLLGHHACCDGAGAMRLLEDLLAAYHDLRSPPEQRIGMRPLEPAMLEDRGLLPAEYGGRFPGARELLRRARDVAGFFTRRPAPLGPGEPAHPGAPCWATATAHLGPETFRGLRRQALRHGVAANDLLLRDLFGCLDEWTRARGGAAGGHLRIAVPVNLRDRARQDRMPAANHGTISFLDRRPGECRDPDDLLGWVHGEMRRIKGHRLAAFVRVMELLSRLPRGVRLLLRSLRGCLATTVFTHLGEPLAHARLPRREGRIVAGDVQVTGLGFFPPLRPLTHAAFSLLRYAGAPRIGLIYDPRRLEEQAARELLDGFVGRVSATAARA